MGKGRRKYTGTDPYRTRVDTVAGVTAVFIFDKPVRTEPLTAWSALVRRTCLHACSLRVKIVAVATTTGEVERLALVACHVEEPFLFT